MLLKPYPLQAIIKVRRIVAKAILTKVISLF